MPKKKTAPSRTAATLTAAAVKRELRKHIVPEKAAFFPRFFKTGKGQYGEGDKFLGVIVPIQRRVAKQFRNLSHAELDKLLHDAYHECRLTGLLILVQQFEAAKNPTEQKRIAKYYLSRLDRVNNWDLVDASAHKIIGPFLETEKDHNLLYRLAKTDHLWSQRAAIVATLHFIKKGDFEDTLRLSELFLTHKHDLMHKAVGWMLRETGKRNEQVLRAFLDKHASSMPRTMLRYAIERLDGKSKAKYMGR